MKMKLGDNIGVISQGDNTEENSDEEQLAPATVSTEPEAFPLLHCSRLIFALLSSGSLWSICKSLCYCQGFNPSSIAAFYGVTARLTAGRWRWESAFRVKAFVRSDFPFCRSPRQLCDDGAWRGKTTPSPRIYLPLWRWDCWRRFVMGGRCDLVSLPRFRCQDLTFSV